MTPVLVESSIVVPPPTFWSGAWESFAGWVPHALKVRTAARATKLFLFTLFIQWRYWE